MLKSTFQVKKVNKDQVVKDLREIFGFKEGEFKTEGLSMQYDYEFHIMKSDFERSEVIVKLREYFNDKIVEGGYVKVNDITFVTTVFEIIEGEPK